MADVVCSHCHGVYAVRLDGTVRTHGPHPYSPGQWDCPGSRKPPLPPSPPAEGE